MTPRPDGDWRPFAVTCRLATPVSLNHPWLHLDGVISHLIRQRVAGGEVYDQPLKRVAHLPEGRMGPYVRTLARRGTAGAWLTCASVSFFGPDPEPRLRSLQSFKRFEADGFPGRSRVNLASGHYRTWLLRTVYPEAETVAFYGRGDLALVRDLLSDLTHLGNDTRVGWGRLAEVTVEPTGEDWSVVRDGRATRPIPTRMLARWDEEAALAWRPPYWAAEHVEACAPPGAGVALGPALA
jgi:hypothetical protein